MRGRADRIDLHGDSMVSILDYKTGTLPERREAESGLATQLRLEAAMARAGAFAGTGARATRELTYWRLTGGLVAGEIVSLFGDDPARIAAAADEAEAGLRHLITRYADPAQPYLAEPDPAALPRFSDYAQLARVAEWPQAQEMRP